MKRKYAVIDLGSNSIRINIIQININGSYNLIDQDKEMVRLSENMGSDNILNEDAILRTVETIKLFKKLIESNQVTTVYALATAAVRRASNRDEFLKRVKNETGIEFKVLSGDEKAYYDYLGVINTIDVKDCIIVDIGGGSTEIILVENREIKERSSLAYGSLNLTEKFSGISGHIERYEAIEDLIDEELDKLDWLSKSHKYPIVGIGGIMRTVGKIDRNINSHPIEIMHNYQLTRSETESILRKIHRNDLENIRKIQGISKRRADIIAAGLIPLKAIFKRTKSKKFIISGNGLRDGYFFESYFTETKQPVIVNDVLNHSMENIMLRYSVNAKHSRKVRELALQLFDGLGSIHSFTDNDRKILDVAALLHDIGMYVEYYNHQFHGFYLTLSSRLFGLSNYELCSAAFIVGNHRDIDLKGKWGEYRSLIDRERYESLKKLSIFLKLAEKLDRSESGNIDKLKVKVDDAVEISLECNSDPGLEVVAAMRHQESFKEHFGKKLAFKY